ncbi:hypothetical protein [Staphylococcus phage phi575]|nr:hypothetical protein [Staphylococcus phage phi575]
MRTPLNGFESDFMSINLPVSELRLTYRLVFGFLTCERFFTAPLRRPSLGGFVAIGYTSLHIGITKLYQKLNKRGCDLYAERRLAS